MRRLKVLLLVGLRLCAARQPGFSIHHDLLAYPQFEVVFSESFISESEAKSLVERASASDTTHPNYEADFNKDVASNVQAASSEDDDEGDRKVADTYEIMNMPPNSYLCAIPVIEPPPAPNKTATELAKAEEARELARASAHGWELINGLDGVCLHYVSGWWSYSFCYGHDVVQYHALPSSHKGGAPVRDPNSQEYVLGRLTDGKSSSKHGHDGRAAPPAEQAGKHHHSPPNSELQVKGDQRYLVQKLEDGTICDLTNRPRTIEIQYHCSPGSTQDRIGWIKEITTCSYLMLVNTPRLCNDVAFQPPRETRANVISCRTILAESEQDEWHAKKTLEAKAAMIGQRHETKAPVTVGGVVVGGRQILGRSEDGKEPARLKPPREIRNLGDGTFVEIIAMGGTDEDGNLSPEELSKFDIDPQLIEQLKKKLEEAAGDKGWKIGVADVDDGRELYGYVDEENGKGDEKHGEKKGKKQDEKEGEEQGSEEKFFEEEL